MCGSRVSIVMKGMIAPGTLALKLGRWMDQRDSTAALSFEDVYMRYADPVYRFCLSQLREPAAAEDGAADVFASAFAAYPAKPLDEGDVRPWLFRIARNAVIDRQRHARVHARWMRAHRVEPNHNDVERTAEIRQTLSAVLAAVGRLDPRDRLLVGLRVAAGLPYAEIGAVLQMSENAARMATHRALEKVRREVRSDS
jgi:RNA polymerase sigma factor (sigma-70 family)